MVAFDAASLLDSSSSRAGSRRASSAWTRFDVDRCGRELFDLMTVEGDLLLQAAVLELAGVRRFPRGSCRRVRGRQLEPQPLEGRLQLGERHSRRRLSDPGVGQTGTRRLDRFAEQPIAPRKLDFLPAAQFLPKASVTARLCRLPLQRPPLFLHLVHDVVDAREILLRCFELELRGATTALVLRDARGFFDELTAIGRAGTQNLADLSLLDDGVGLHAEPESIRRSGRPQPAGRAVDRVFTLTGAVEAAHQLDVADDQRDVILEGEGRAGFGEQRGTRFDGGPAVRAAVAVAVFRRPPCRNSREAQSNFSRGGRLSCVAPPEDHVFHAIAAQTLGALLAEDPRQGIDHVALAAPVGADDGRDAVVECELRSIRKALEARDLETIQPHDGTSSDPGLRPGPRRLAGTPPRRSGRRAHGALDAYRIEKAAHRRRRTPSGSGWERFERLLAGIEGDVTRTVQPSPHPADRRNGPWAQ